MYIICLHLQEQGVCQVVYVNCMSCANSAAIFNKILGEIRGKDTSLSAKEASQQLIKTLTSSGTTM